jgi:hypothetical protein
MTSGRHAPRTVFGHLPIGSCRSGGTESGHSAEISMIQRHGDADRRTRQGSARHGFANPRVGKVNPHHEGMNARVGWFCRRQALRDAG